MTEFPLEFIEWTDAVSEDNWISLEKALKESKLSIIHTVGWLLLEDKEKLVVAMQKDLDGEAVSMTMTIPKAWIKRRRKLDRS